LAFPLAKRRGNPEPRAPQELDCFVARAPRNDGVRDLN
jgi:hypothetical protein